MGLCSSETFSRIEIQRDDFWPLDEEPIPPGLSRVQWHIGIGACVRLLPLHEDPFQFGSLVLSVTAEKWTSLGWTWVMGLSVPTT